MRDPVGERHGAGGEKRCRPGEQADEDQSPADQLDDAGRPGQAEGLEYLLGGRIAEQLLRAMQHENEARRRPEHAEDTGLPGREVRIHV